MERIINVNYQPIPGIYSQILNDILRSTLEKDSDKRVSVTDILGIPSILSLVLEL